MSEAIVISKLVEVAHVLSVGVKVYLIVPIVVVLIVLGVQVPIIPLVDVEGNSGAEVFWQSGPIGKNVGAISEAIVIIEAPLVVPSVQFKSLTEVRTYVVFTVGDTFM